jgi:hypothetical protein
MTSKTPFLIAAALAALSIPDLASAQSWNGWRTPDPSDRVVGYDGHSYGGYGYGSSYRDGDYSGSHGWDGFSGFPEFSGEKEHISAEIQQGLQEGWLDDGGADGFWRDLRRVQDREFREYREHGWNLPDHDRADIRRMLDRLDHDVDEARDNS